MDVEKNMCDTVIRVVWDSNFLRIIMNYTATYDIGFMWHSCVTRSELTVVFSNTG